MSRAEFKVSLVVGGKHLRRKKFFSLVKEHLLLAPGVPKDSGFMHQADLMLHLLLKPEKDLVMDGLYFLGWLFQK